MNFKEWFIINEGKEEKALALELADGNPSVISSLSEVIPQNQKETDPLLLLATYYYSKNKNVEQIKTDMRDYIGFLKNNRMPLINVDLISKEPISPWNSYIRWTETIHGHQGEDATKKASSLRPSDIDFQNEVAFMKSDDGKIKVYKAHSPQQCIILGKGQSFCISQPGNRMWQSYRDSQTSTFYFVYDNTRDDRLSIVVVDVRGDGSVVLTDKVNDTGKTLDPYGNQVTTNSDSYMRYLGEKGIDVSKMENIPKSDEEIAEDRKLGNTNNKLDWFRSLSHDEKSKYIGRGHLLSNEQFDYLWENKFVSLLTQYVKTGLKLPDYQIDKVATNRDLRDNYVHNRLIANQQNKNLNKKEFDLLKEDQKRKLLGSIENVIKFGSVEDIKALVEKGAKIGQNEVFIAAKHGNLDMVKYLVEKGAKIGDIAVSKAAADGNLDMVKYLVEKGANTDDGVFGAAKHGNLDMVKYFVEKGAKIGDIAVSKAAENGHLDVVKYLVEKGANTKYGVSNAIHNGHLDVVKYLLEKIGGKIGDYAVEIVATDGNLDMVKYLVEKGAKIGNAVAKAEKYGHQDIVDYLKSELEKRNKSQIQ